MKGQIPLAPQKEESGELFSKSWWYRCPVCHDPLDYKQKRCGYCEQRIDWGAEAGDITVCSVVKGKDGEQE